MVTLNAHYDGKSIIPDEPTCLPFPSGTRLKVSVEAIGEMIQEERPTRFRPLDIRIDSGLSNAIALQPEFNAEES